MSDGKERVAVEWMEEACRDEDDLGKPEEVIIEEDEELPQVGETGEGMEE